MQVLGFNFTKIQAERFLDAKPTKNHKINSNIEFTNVEKEKAEILNTDLLKLSFKLNLIFDPKMGELNFEGAILIKAEDSKTKEIMKQWKDKKISEDVKVPLLNLILNKCTLKALQLEDELGLPKHINIPKLQIKKSDK